MGRGTVTQPSRNRSLHSLSSSYICQTTISPKSNPFPPTSCLLTPASCLLFVISESANQSIATILKLQRSPMVAIAAALFVGAGLILLTGKNPLTAYSVLFTESLTNYYGIGNTLTKMAPLLLAGLGP